MTPVLFGVMLYVLAQLAIGMLLSRRITSESDYLLAGRSLGLGLATFSVFATWFGAETVVGAAGAIYEKGLSGGAADPFGYAACLLLMGFFFAVPLWRRGLTTLADLFRQRYSSGVERLAVLLIVPTSIMWAAAQIRAFGQVISAASALVEHNLIAPLRPGLGDRAKVRIARGGVALFGVLAYLLALHAEGIYQLVQASSAFGGAGIFIIVMFGLFTRIGGPRAALATLLTGVMAWLAGEFLFGWPVPYLTSLAAAFSAYLVLALFERSTVSDRLAIP